ncbi:zona pellucida sperm-binding protein 3 isoform X2 [Amia ocellicauda]|uniref:zona pellucida sperm-binding protein 3 isoform X2 n=1 Tax=Amia ocellicauda TaxID=2972642 RepID=UPI003463AB63
MQAYRSGLGAVVLLMVLACGVAPADVSHQAVLELISEAAWWYRQQLGQTISATCGESAIEVLVNRDLFGTGQLIKASDVRLGDCHLTRQDESRQMVDDKLVYLFSLNYHPTRTDSSPIVRTHDVNVNVVCHYNRLHNVSSDGLKPTWVPFTETQSAEDFLDFSLQLMTDDWSSQRPSNVFYLGDVLNLQAEVRVAGHVPLRLFADGCVATLASDPTSEPRYSFVENYGCLTDAKVTGSSSWFRPRPLDFTKLQMQLDAFRFHQDSRSLIYITCHLKVILASQNVDSVNKACYFEGGRWRSADGSDLVCGCCDSSCGPDSKSKRQRRIKSRRAVPSNAAPLWAADASVGPLQFLGRSPDYLPEVEMGAQALLDSVRSVNTGGFPPEVVILAGVVVAVGLACIIVFGGAVLQHRWSQPRSVPS